MPEGHADYECTPEEGDEEDPPHEDEDDGE